MKIKHFYYRVLYLLHIKALAIIYRDKLTIKVNEHLLNKDKIDNQLTGESHRDDSGQVHFSNEE